MTIAAAVCADGHGKTGGVVQLQKAYAVALAAYEAGERTTDAELVPTYLRLPQAERELKSKLNK